MQSPLPSNDALLEFSSAVDWESLEQTKRRFNTKLKQLAQESSDDRFPLGALEEAAGVPLSLVYDDNTKGNVILAEIGGKKVMLASFVSNRYRKGNSLLRNVVPYNFNPSVNHTNLEDTETPDTRLRAIGAELELGLYVADGGTPTDEQVETFVDVYKHNALKFGITPQVDHEACKYQVEVHVAPGVGYNGMRNSLDSIMASLVAASQATNLNTAIFSAFPIESDFALADDPKVQTAVDVMMEVNERFPEYIQRREEIRNRYHIGADANIVQLFRLQGCHVHLDIAGRSEALGLLTYYTMLRSATAIANGAVLKGTPFVNGTCDPELLCTREYLRSSTVTGRYIEMPVTPHFSDDGLECYGSLLQNERANSAVRGLLYEDGLGEPISVMHNPIGRVRPDLGSSKRICTLESTGMPINISASRQAAVLSDFEFTHAVLENYFREHGLNLAPMYEDETLLAIVGPLSTEDFIAQQHESDRQGSDVVVQTAAGTQMSLAEFYEMKRMYMHRAMVDVPSVLAREIDNVYMSLNRMLEPPSGRKAETVEQYIVDTTTRSTGNWGLILRNAFEEEGGTIGSRNPEAVLRVANRVHEALVERYG